MIPPATLAAGPAVYCYIDNPGAGALHSTMIRTLRTLAAGPLIVLAMAALASVRAADEPPPPRGPALTAEELAGAVKTDLLTIPTPGELLAAIDKLGKPDWASAVRPPIPANLSSRPQMAINIGALIADGYIAVEASSAQQVKNVGKDIRLVATGLGVGSEIIKRGDSLTEFADSGKWDTLKEEFEATQNEVKAAMREKKDSDLITLVTLGGWIRGIEAMSDYVSKHYTEEGAKLLRQPGIIRYLDESLSMLPERVRDDASVRKARAGLGSMEKALSFPPDVAPSQESVSQLQEISSSLLKELAKKKS
jgi:hypothetical protein